MQTLVDEIRDAEIEFSQKKTATDEHLANINANSETVGNIREQTESRWDQIQEQANMMEQQANSSAELLEAHQETSESISNIAEGIENDKNTVSDLFQNIQNADAVANQFSEKADAHEVKVAELFSNLDGLTKKHSTINDEIAEINKMALEMLSTANNSGLASAYAERIEEADKRLKLISDQFVNAIIALAASSLPLLVYALGPVIASLFGNEPDTAIQLAAQTDIGSAAITTASSGPTLSNNSFDGNRWASALTLSLIMIPAAWYAKFRATEYSTLFKLRELYAHKYSLAKSVDGFKKQAPEYADEIAATTYGQLTENPTKHLDVKDMDKHPSPLVEALLQKLTKNKQSPDNRE